MTRVGSGGNKSGGLTTRTKRLSFFSFLSSSSSSPSSASFPFSFFLSLSPPILIKRTHRSPVPSPPPPSPPLPLPLSYSRRLPNSLREVPRDLLPRSPSLPLLLVFSSPLLPEPEENRRAVSEGDGDDGGRVESCGGGGIGPDAGRGPSAEGRGRDEAGARDGPAAVVVAVVVAVVAVDGDGLDGGEEDSAHALTVRSEVVDGGGVEVQNQSCEVGTVLASAPTNRTNDGSLLLSQSSPFPPALLTH